MTKSTETNLHMHLIAAMVNYLISKGYKVSADHIGYPNGKPNEFMGQTPDIQAKKDNEEIFIEAVTCDMLNKPETKVKWFTLTQKPNVSLSLIVQKKCLQEAKKNASDWGINVKNIYSVDVEV